MPEENIKIIDWFLEKLTRNKSRAIILIAALLISDVFVWVTVAKGFSVNNLELDFFSVGQGDSEMVVLPGGVKMLIDGGPPNGKVLEGLGKVLAPQDRYIDLVMMSHPQLDHFGGLIEVLERYRVGAFLTNGQEGSAPAFEDLKETLAGRGIRVVTLGAGDKISWNGSYFYVLSPTAELLKSKEVNDATLVVELLSNSIRALFTGDAGEKVEGELAKISGLNADILKVSHHGSKYSSSPGFLDKLGPKIAVIEVGRNSYGHPTPEALGRLGNVGARVFRTDTDGSIKLRVGESGAASVFKF